MIDLLVYIAFVLGTFLLLPWIVVLLWKWYTIYLDWVIGYGK